MALVLKNRVLETCTSPGTGTVTLLGATTGYQTFSATVGNGNTCYYTIADQGSANWEVGIGTYATTGNTLTRNTVLSSSNGGGLTNFSTGTQNVFVDYPAEKAVYLDASGNAIPLGSASATQLDITAQGDLRLQDTTGGEYVALQAPATIATSYTLTLPVDDGTAGQALVTDGSGVLSWSTAASGDVYGPASATDTAIATFDGVTGKLIKNNASTTIASNVITALGFTGPHNGTVGATTPSTGAFTTLSGTGQLTLTNASNYNLYASGAGGNYMASNLGVGAVTTNDVPLLVATVGTGTNLNGARVYPTIPATTTASFKAFQSIGTTVAAAFTLPNLSHFEAFQGAIGAGSTVTAQYGFIAQANLTGATNNYGFYSGIASGTARWNFYAAGTADNYMAGNLGVTGTPDVNLHVANATAKLRLGATASNAYLDISRDSATGFTIYNAAQTTFSAHIFQIAGTEYARIATTGTISLGAAPGSESLRVTPVASSVNFLEINGAIAASRPFLFANGSDTNVSMNLVTKGTGAFVFLTGTGSNTQFQIAHTASAVNYLQVQGGSTGNAPILLSTGSDTNVNFTLQTKGTGSYYIYGGGAYFYNNSSAPQFAVVSTASAVNYLQVQGGATGSPPLLQATGSDTNVPLTIYTKGTGYINLQIGSSTQFFVLNTASAVNYLQATGGATGNSAKLLAAGSDTNIDLALTPKGTGVVQYGTYTAGILAQAGYITIKDAGGTTRNLLVG